MFALFKKKSASFSRCLGLLLVAFILYGATVDAAHRHGRVQLSTAETTSHALDNQQTNNFRGNKTGCSDCLICQLQQNFTATLIALRLSDPPAQLSHRITADVLLALFSRLITPLAGRAPPFIS